MVFVTQFIILIFLLQLKREVLCIELKYLRAITGAADGKVRIWNILNGDCIRVLRGNSRSDPILSMSIVDNRILLNTDNNVLLMEFEPIQLEYGSNIEETVEHKLKHQIVAKKPKSYSSIRASRMELVSTPNVRLFNDDRKTVMDHSSRPISGKCLKDARNIYSAVSRSGNNHIVTNSAGHISESALAKRRSIMESINAIISSQGSISNLSYTKNIDFMNQNDLKVEF